MSICRANVYGSVKDQDSVYGTAGSRSRSGGG